MVLVPQPLNHRVSDTVSAHVAPRSGGVWVSGVVVVHEASEIPSRSFARWHRALDAGKCCVTGSCVNAGAAAAELPRERCRIGACCAHKWWRICFGDRCDARSIGDTQQQLCAVASRPDAGKCCVTESCVNAGAAAADLSREQCCSAQVGPQNGGASVSELVVGWSIEDTEPELCTVVLCLDAGKRCVTESSVCAGAAVANLQCEQCYRWAGGRQKMPRICFGGS
jgi:hypothetical protein